MTKIMIKVGDESAESYIGALKQFDPSLNILEWPNYGNQTKLMWPWYGNYPMGNSENSRI